MPRVRQETRTSSCYGRLASHALLSGSDDDDEFENHPSERSYDASNRSRSYPARTHNFRSRLRSISNSLSFEDIGMSDEGFVNDSYISRYHKVARILHKALVTMLTNVVISVIVIALGVTISLALGLHSLLVLKPFPIIDKSIKAFSIPNHISSQRQDALSVAKADQKKYLSSIGYRRRRDLNLDPVYFSDRYDLAKQERIHKAPKQTADKPNILYENDFVSQQNDSFSRKDNLPFAANSVKDNYSSNIRTENFKHLALPNTADSGSLHESSVKKRYRNRQSRKHEVLHDKFKSGDLSQTGGIHSSPLTEDNSEDSASDDPAGMVLNNIYDVPSITQVSSDDLKQHLYDVLQQRSQQTNNWLPWQSEASSDRHSENRPREDAGKNSSGIDAFDLMASNIHKKQKIDQRYSYDGHTNHDKDGDGHGEQIPSTSSEEMDNFGENIAAETELYFSNQNTNPSRTQKRSTQPADRMSQASVPKSHKVLTRPQRGHDNLNQGYLAEFLHEADHDHRKHAHKKKSMEPHHQNEGSRFDHHRRKRRQLGADARIYGRTQALRRWKMQIVYLAEGDGDLNVFTEENLKQIHKIEKKVQKLHGYESFCLKDYYKWDHDSNLNTYGGCAPLNSLMTYFYPSQTSDGMIHYDGLGDTLADVNKTLAFAMAHETFFWFVDDKINQSNRKSRLLRTEVHFGVPLPGYLYYSDRQEEQHKKFVDFVLTYIDLLSRQSTPNLRVLYGGNEIFDYQVDSTFWSDLHLSFVTFGLILVFMFILTSFSLWLTFWGILSIILSFPLAFFFYRQVFGVIHLGILNGAAAFVVIGIGVDDVFVFINTFRQAHHIPDQGERMLYTLAVAGKATFFTSFTTAAAFAANVASSIPAIHDFGLFMSLIVGCCWVMVVIVMPPAINIWLRYFAPCERACYSRCVCSCKKVKPLDLPTDIVNYLRGDRTSAATTSLAESVPSSDDSGIAMDAASTGSNDDVPLLRMDDINNHEGGWPIYLGMLNQMMYEDDDPLLTLDGGDEDEMVAREDLIIQSETLEGCTLTNQIQAFLYYCIAQPIVRARWLVFGIYMVVLIIAVCLMVQLKPATRPPQLFESSTNLQKLMDLAANFSDSAITCDECSAFYKEGSVKFAGQMSGLRKGGGGSGPLGSNGESLPAIYTIRTPTKARTVPGGKDSAEHRITADKTTPPEMSGATTQSPAGDSSSTTQSAPGSLSGHDDDVTIKNVQPPRIGRHKQPVPASQRASVYDPCTRGKCDVVSKRPNLELGAVIYVVFGIKGIDRSNVSYQHVLTDKGSAIYDEAFVKHFSLQSATLDFTLLRNLCQICKMIANNTELVKTNSSQCIPRYGIPVQLIASIRVIPECSDLPEYVNHQLPGRAAAGLTPIGIQWIAFSFESTTYKGQSYFTAYREYQKWESFINHLKTNVIAKDSPLQTIYQTSEFWENVMMEVVAVSSAIYGLVLSMIICITTVTIFTGHITLLLIVVATMFGTICMVVAIFFMAGWEMGAIEAVSLSILVGSSVDYSVHLVEGYLIAGKNPPASVTEDVGSLRRWRTLVAVSHIGVSITSSALTTIVAAIPLTLTIIQPFSKFGQIVTINTSMSILYTLTAGVAFLALAAPARYTNSWRSTIIATLFTSSFIAILILILFIISRFGVDIPAPNGENLFSK